MAETIVIVEDDESIREMLRYYFRSVGYHVESYESGEAYFEAEREQVPSLFILDIMLPGMDGLEILRRIRSDPALKDVPTLMLTARTSEMDKVKGLESGADDYVVKPFGIMELQARVKALLRRTGRNKTEEVIICGDLEIDPAAREVRKAGVPVELTYKEFELLKLLASRRGMVLSRDDILQAVWDYNFAGETRTVDMHVKTLRQKLGEGYIQTVRGVGYKMA
ncbi:MAG TPA: response regulator transcription factor [Candidatus Intestinimonas stercoravium]|uniref:response regulator transcription factor n=1 Tax=uncultured Intestinimonas sp. TaxID=1689265 RepID=UPI001F8909D2|nr:response regulator transcription factor [uncultured Intestinimonas sp.]HJA63621.1 response regulator transcription factor [Candidatus Intestinimonas stercoravium]